MYRVLRVAAAVAEVPRWTTFYDTSNLLARRGCYTPSPTPPPPPPPQSNRILSHGPELIYARSFIQEFHY